MNKNFIKYVCVLSLGLSPVAVQATSGIETTGSSVKDSSDKAKDSNQQGQMMSYLMAAMLAAQSAQHFAKCPKPSPGDCAMGALKAAMAVMSMMQGKAHGQTAAGAGLSSNYTDGTNYNPVDDPYGIDNPNNPLNQDGDFRALKQNMAKLEKCVAGSCIDVKKGTIKTADGKSYKISDFASPEAMAAAGLPPGAISGAMAYGDTLSKLAKDKMDKLKLGGMTAATGFDEGGGGGGGSGSGASSEDAVAAYAGGAANLDRDPSSVAGMQKNYNGEPIGVAADSIFLMMNRRYKVKESQDSFFSETDLALQK